MTTGSGTTAEEADVITISSIVAWDFLPARRALNRSTLPD
jgi:hypothetical protein